jgi:hypothetical protein
MVHTHAGKLKYFTLREFTCGCGCGMVSMSGELLLMLDEARAIAGRPLVITSGYRCRKHNNNVGGSPTSSHLTGKAVDISCRGDRDRGAIISGLIHAGFRRIGIAKTFIHADVEEKKSGAVWLYV